MKVITIIEHNNNIIAEVGSEIITTQEFIDILEDTIKLAKEQLNQQKKDKDYTGGM